MQQFKYEIIAEKINNLIDSGVYPEGSKLPPHRILAEELSTTAVTVAKAYQLLVERRRIKSYVGRGSYVSSDRLENVINASESGELNFSILQPCLAGNSVFDRQMTQYVDSLHTCSSLQQYNEDTGLLSHRKAAARWCENFGLDITDCRDGQGIVLTNGAQGALAAIIQLYSKEGDCIAVEAQTYPGVLSICKYLNRRVVPIEMDEHGMIPSALSQQCEQDKPSLVIVVPSEQNPTTATMPIQRRIEIAKVIDKESLWLIEDDLYAFLNESVLTPITNLIPNRAFYISSLSKAISPGLRCGFMKTPKDQWNHVVDFIRATLWLVSPITFEFASQLICSGEAFKLADKQKQKAALRQSLITEYLSDCHFKRQLNSYACWVLLPKGCDSSVLTEELKKNGVLVSDSTFFNVLGNNNAIRLSVMSVEKDSDFISGLKIIKKSINASV